MSLPPQDRQNSDIVDALLALIDIMKTLRHPEQGCPWDLAQTHESIVPYTIEEAYEVAEAVAKGDPR